MAENQGTLITAPIRPFDSADGFPAFFANDGAGGWHQVPDEATMQAIHGDRLVEGMVCWVQGEKQLFQWIGGAWVAASLGGSGGALILLEYGEGFGTNECFRNIDGIITHVTSKDVTAPHVDGITLQSGSAGAYYPGAVLTQQPYQTPLALAGADGDTLFLSQSGQLTPVIPSGPAGDVWSLPVARRVGPNTFIFSPGFLVHL